MILHFFRVVLASWLRLLAARARLRRTPSASTRAPVEHFRAFLLDGTCDAFETLLASVRSLACPSADMFHRARRKFAEAFLIIAHSALESIHTTFVRRAILANCCISAEAFGIVVLDGTFDAPERLLAPARNLAFPSAHMLHRVRRKFAEVFVIVAHRAHEIKHTTFARRAILADS